MNFPQRFGYGVFTHKKYCTPWCQTWKYTTYWEAKWKVNIAWPNKEKLTLNSLCANPIKWSNTLKQFFGNSRRIVEYVWPFFWLVWSCFATNFYFCNFREFLLLLCRCGFSRFWYISERLQITWTQLYSRVNSWESRDKSTTSPNIHLKKALLTFS